MEDNKKKEKKNTEDKVYVILSIITVVAIICGIVYFYINSAINEAKHQQELESYEQMAQDYLKNKYNKNFELTLGYEGYKTKGTYFDATYFAIGKDKNIREYSYAANSPEGINSNITVWKNLQTGEITIDENYELMKNIAELERQIKNIVSGYYTSYEIEHKLKNYNKDNDEIIVNINHDYKEELNNNLECLSKILELLQNGETIVTVKYNEWATFNIRQDTSIEDEKADFEFVKQIEEYMEANYQGTYSMTFLNVGSIFSSEGKRHNRYNLSVVLNASVSENNNINNEQVYKKIYDYLLSFYNYDKGSIWLKYNDGHALVSSYSDWKGDYIKEK